MSARIVSRFSCGAASAVATKLVLAEFGDTRDVHVINAFIKQEHEDNARFMADFDDAAHWNSRNVPWKGKPIDPDPDGELRRIADGIDRMLAEEEPAASTAPKEPTP